MASDLSTSRLQASAAAPLSPENSCAASKALPRRPLALRSPSRCHIHMGQVRELAQSPSLKVKVTLRDFPPKPLQYPRQVPKQRHPAGMEFSAGTGNLLGAQEGFLEEETPRTAGKEKRGRGGDLARIRSTLMRGRKGARQGGYTPSCPHKGRVGWETLGWESGMGGCRSQQGLGKPLFSLGLAPQVSPFLRGTNNDPIPQHPEFLFPDWETEAQNSSAGGQRPARGRGSVSGHRSS